MIFIGERLWRNKNCPSTPEEVTEITEMSSTVSSQDTLLRSSGPPKFEFEHLTSGIILKPIDVHQTIPRELLLRCHTEGVDQSQLDTDLEVVGVRRVIFAPAHGLDRYYKRMPPHAVE